MVSDDFNDVLLINRSLANMAVPAGQAGDFNQVSLVECL